MHILSAEPEREKEKKRFSLHKLINTEKLHNRIRNKKAWSIQCSCVSVFFHCIDISHTRNVSSQWIRKGKFMKTCSARKDFYLKWCESRTWTCIRNWILFFFLQCNTKMAMAFVIALPTNWISIWVESTELNSFDLYWDVHRMNESRLHKIILNAEANEVRRRGGPRRRSDFWTPLSVIWMREVLNWMRTFRA